MFFPPHKYRYLRGYSHRGNRDASRQARRAAHATQKRRTNMRTKNHARTPTKTFGRKRQRKQNNVGGNPYLCTEIFCG